MAGHHHFIVNEGDIYTSPNSPTIPTVPDPCPLSVDTPDISNFQKPRWAETRHLFLAYVPLSPRYDRPPFDRLRCFGKTFSVVRSMSNWRVAPAIVTQFETLENNLLFIVDTLLRAGGALVHLDFSLVLLPNQYGYKREHTHKHAKIYNEPSIASSLVIQDDLEDKIYYCYGFVDLGLPTELQPTAKWDTVQIVFRMTGAKVPEKLRGPISLFMESLISNEREKIMPEHLWDLSSDLSPFASVANPGLRVSQVMNSNIINSDTHYVIKSRNASGNNTGWQLVVDDAAIVLECFRQDRDTIQDISIALLSSGQPFSTRILRDQCCQSILRPQPSLTLGWRTPSYQPTTTEYGFYEQLRKDFFTRPHSRAAFLKGGLIWRLAIESIGILANELVLNGPSDEVLDFGTSIEPKALWDDDLCDTDMDLICGVYKVFTCE